MNEVQSIGALAAQLAGMAGVAACIWILSATKSLHPLRHIVWRAVYGQEPPSDSQVAAFAAQQTSLMNFRHFSGIETETLAEAHRFIEWAAVLGMPLRKISTAMKYIDVRSMSVKADAVAKFKTKTWLSAVCAAYALTVLAGGVAFSKVGMFRVTATGTHFAVSTSSVAVWNDGMWPQVGGHTQCSMGTPSFEWSNLDRDAICELIKSKEFKVRLQDGIRDLRLLALMLVALFGWSFWLLAVELWAHRCARKILDRMEALASDKVQLQIH